MFYNRINGLEPPEVVNGFLRDLNEKANGQILIYDKEVAFRTPKSRKLHCEKFDENSNDYGTSRDMVRYARNNRTTTTVFLLANKQTSANKYTLDYKNNGNYNEVSEANRNQLLDWHNQILIYKQPNVFVFDSMFDDNDSLFHNRTLTGNLKSRINDFRSYAKECSLPVNKVFIGGPGKVGNCRKLCFMFLKDFVKKKAQQLAFTAIKFFEFTRGPRPSAVPLDEINEI